MRPRHEPVKSAHRANQLMPRPQIQVIGVAENDLRAKAFEIRLRLAFHRGGRAYRHKRGRFDHSMRGGKTPETRTRRIGGQNFKLKWHPVECSRRVGKPEFTAFEANNERPSLARDARRGFAV